MTAFEAEFVEFQQVKTRSVYKIVLEIPAEQADAALAILGGVPKPNAQVWVAVARLAKGPNGFEGNTERAGVATFINRSSARPKQSDGARGQDPEKPVSSQASPRPAPSETNRWQTRAAMLCKNVDFQDWIGVSASVSSTTADHERDAAQMLCEYLRIKSRAELATNPEAQKRLLLVEAQYRAEVGNDDAG
jgi:hypothetical protein